MLRCWWVAIVLLVAGSGASLHAQVCGVTPPVWEPTFGAPLGLGDDSVNNSTFADWSFSFPFATTMYTGTSALSVSANGFFSMGGANLDCCSGSPLTLVNGPFARIAVFWTDLFPPGGGDVHIEAFDDYGLGAINDRLVVTWDTVEIFTLGPVTAQAQLFSDGTIVFGYDCLDLGGFSGNTLIGFSPAAGAVDPGSTDFTASVPFDSGNESTIYEFWPGLFGTDTPVDTLGMNLVFRPNGLGGYFVSDTLAPENDDCSNRVALSEGIIFGTFIGATNDGTSSCGSSGASPDLWYSYVATAAGTLDVSTCGTHDGAGVDTGVDTVLAAFDACGGFELDCNDDTGVCLGHDSGSLRDSAITVSVQPGDEIVIRLTTFGGESGGQFQLNTTFTPAPCSTCEGLRGDANNDGGIDISDAIYLLEFLFASGTGPQPCAATGDPNGDTLVDIGDAIYLLDFLFSLGMPPVSPGYPTADCLDLLPSKKK